MDSKSIRNHFHKLEWKIPFPVWGLVPCLLEFYMAQKIMKIFDRMWVFKQWMVLKTRSKMNFDVNMPLSFIEFNWTAPNKYIININENEITRIDMKYFLIKEVLVMLQVYISRNVVLQYEIIEFDNVNCIENNVICIN